jgi:hypothetical protein
MGIGPQTRTWLDAEAKKWQADEHKRKEAEKTQRWADTQGAEGWNGLFASLKELNDQSVRGETFRWSEEYGLLYRNSCAQLLGEINDHFIGHVNFIKNPGPMQEPFQEWRITPAMSPSNDFGWVIQGWPGATDTKPKDVDYVVLAIAQTLVDIP